MLSHCHGTMRIEHIGQRHSRPASMVHLMTELVDHSSLYCPMGTIEAFFKEHCRGPIFLQERAGA